jgi:hypothetical protein
MCEALEHEHYVKKGELHVRETRKKSEQEGGNYFYKAHFETKNAAATLARFACL